MRDHRPVARALLMTTAAAWSIGAPSARQTDRAASASWGESVRGSTLRQPGPVVLPFRRSPRATAARTDRTTPGRGAA